MISCRRARWADQRRAVSPRIDYGQPGSLPFPSALGRGNVAGNRRLAVRQEGRVSKKLAVTASRINSRNSSVFWESDRNADYVHTYLLRHRDVEGTKRPELNEWIDQFEKESAEAAFGVLVRDPQGHPRIIARILTRLPPLQRKLRRAAVKNIPLGRALLPVFLLVTGRMPVLQVRQFLPLAL